MSSTCNIPVELFLTSFSKDSAQGIHVHAVFMLGNDVWGIEQCHYHGKIAKVDVLKMFKIHHDAFGTENKLLR